MTFEARDLEKVVHVPSDEISTFEVVPTPEEAVARLIALYDAAIEAQRQALERFFAAGSPRRAEERAKFRYPELRVDLSRDRRPADQAARLCEVSGARAFTRRPSPSRPSSELPAGTTRLSGRRLRRDDRGRRQRSGNSLPLCVRAGRRAWVAAPIRLRSWRSSFRRHFSPRSAMRSPMEPGSFARDEPRPLSLFDAARTDYSLRRLVHYTGSRLAIRPAVDPAHQLSSLCRPVRALGGVGAGERE